VKTKQNKKSEKQKAHHLDETAAAAAAAAAHCVHVCVSIDSWMQIGSADSRRGQKTRERLTNDFINITRVKSTALVFLPISLVCSSMDNHYYGVLAKDHFPSPLIH
jgi:hypothetical protein